MALRNKAKDSESVVSDQIIIDPTTELQWSRTFADRMNWKAAKKFAADCRIGGYDDWRVPTRKELLTLVDDTQFNPAANAELFPDMESSWYWTSTPLASSPGDYAWGVLFANGLVGYYLQDYTAFVRLVRSSRASQ